MYPTRARRIVLICAALVVLAMLLFPPYLIRGNGMTFNAGFASLFRAPAAGATVAVGTLVAEFLAVAIIAALLSAAFGPKSR